MSYRIFLSHNFNDKPFVEPVAIKLAEIFGPNQVFYDSWSIQPGDGIIDQMNKGLKAPEFVFFFASKKSLESNMVKLEWQNALYSATNGEVRLIPIRIDDIQMPPIMMQNLYIDMHAIGLEAAIAQIVRVAQGNASFTPQYVGFSNLTYHAIQLENGSIDIIIRASHLMESNPSFFVAVGNLEEDIAWEMPNATAFIGGFKSVVSESDGTVIYGKSMRPVSRALTPSFPLNLRLSKKGAVDIDFRGILHEISDGKWMVVPSSTSRVSEIV